jgi:hypothetical protein
MVKAKPTTAKGYLKALRSHHIENGFETTVFEDPRIELIIRDDKRYHGEGTKKLRLPLIAELLQRIIYEIKSNDPDSLNIKAALCVAFAAFLRSGEFTYRNKWNESSPQTCLARRHVTFNPNNSIILILPVSKTDPFRKDIIIELASTPSPLCPVRALRELYAKQPYPTTNPLFSRSFGQSFNKQYIVNKVRELLLRAGISTLGFSGHSIRKGAAVSAAAKGISKENIKLLGRWKSDAVDVYINEVSQAEHTQKLLQLNAQLLFTPPKLGASLATYRAR